MENFELTHFVHVGCDVVGKAGLVEEDGDGPKRMCFVELYGSKGILLCAFVDKSSLTPIKSEEVIE